MLTPKPEREAFDAVFSLDGIQSDQAAMFEDDPRNRREPYAMGMQTILVAPQSHDAQYIQHHTVDLSDFLKQLV